MYLLPRWLHLYHGFQFHWEILRGKWYGCDVQMEGYLWMLLGQQVSSTPWLGSQGVLENLWYPGGFSTTKCSDQLFSSCHIIIKKKKRQTRFTVFTLSTFFFKKNHFPFLPFLINPVFSLFLNTSSVKTVSLTWSFWEAIYPLLFLKTVWIEPVWAPYI